MSKRKRPFSAKRALGADTLPKKSKSERKLEMREQAKRKMRGGGSVANTQRSYASAVEKGRKDLNVKSTQAGVSQGKKFKAEIDYLLRNYLPRYDSRIETLIDEWRRCGDPGYSPDVKTRLREARRIHMRDSHAH